MRDSVVMSMWIPEWYLCAQPFHSSSRRPPCTLLPYSMAQMEISLLPELAKCLLLCSVTPLRAACLKVFRHYDVTGTVMLARLELKPNNLWFILAQSGSVQHRSQVSELFLVVVWICLHCCLFHISSRDDLWSVLLSFVFLHMFKNYVNKQTATCNCSGEIPLCVSSFF